jgi:hypothetical protein
VPHAQPRGGPGFVRYTAAVQQHATGAYIYIQISTARLSRVQKGSGTYLTYIYTQISTARLS